MAAALRLTMAVLPVLFWMQDGLAATSIRDVQVAIRTIVFMVPPPAERMPLAVLYDSQSPSSVADAKAIVDSISGGVARWVMVEATAVDVRTLSAAPAYRAVFVSGGLETWYQPILNYAVRNSTLTLSAGSSCVEAAICTIGVSTQHGVEVMLSRDAASRTHLEFSSAFRMMVRER